MKKNIFLLLTILSMILFSGCRFRISNGVEDIPEVTGSFDIHIIQAGQADAMILTTENCRVIIDCGEKDDGDDIAKYLKENNINHIDYMFITHFDKDHIGGFPEVMENVEADNIIVPAYEGTNKEYQQYAEMIRDNNISVTELTTDMLFTLDDCLFEVKPPQKTSYDGDNDFSLVISVTHGNNKFLFAGDAEEMRLSEIMKTFQREYDFLKVPHHGRYNSLTKSFFEWVQPQYAVVTDSDKNPAEEKTLDCLDKINCKTYQTKDGSIDIFSNSKEITIIQ